MSGNPVQICETKPRAVPCEENETCTQWRTWGYTRPGTNLVRAPLPGPFVGSMDV